MHFRAPIIRFFFLLLALLSVSVLVFAFRAVILPPKITLHTVRDFMTVPSGTIMIEGTAVRARTLRVQGKQITQTEKGDFAVRVPTFVPYTIIEVVATDRFEKEQRVSYTLLVE